uniref:Myb/SANT-like DNA-binding domain-containing protein n=1 Tax=Mola mola TaxID=94237 RepID=A0A3Q3VTW5_MOLML
MYEPVLKNFLLCLSVTSKETEYFVRLRVSNNHLFSGRRNTSMWAWRAILKRMGLQQRMTHHQASKKWENMKKRYKVLKNPPDGVNLFPDTWPYFSLMDDAMEGRLQGHAPILTVVPGDKDEDDFLPVSKPQKKVPMVINSGMDSSAGGSEVSLNGDENSEEEEGRQEIDCIMHEVDQDRNLMDNKRQVMDREKEVMERERLVLQRERAVLDREIAILERDRASLERERAMIEREKAVLERERTMLERERDAVSRERLALEQQRSRLERLSASKERTEEFTEESSEGCNQCGCPSGTGTAGSSCPGQNECMLRHQ